MGWRPPSCSASRHRQPRCYWGPFVQSCSHGLLLLSSRPRGGVAPLARRKKSYERAGRRGRARAQRDISWLAGAIICGGIAGPLLLMLGLAQTDAAGRLPAPDARRSGDGADRLDCFPREHQRSGRHRHGLPCRRRGDPVVVRTPHDRAHRWPARDRRSMRRLGLDNNLTRKVSLSDPLQIVQFKGLVAGPVNVALGLWTGNSLPETPTC